MSLRVSLYAKILGWSVLNLVLVGGILLALLGSHLRSNVPTAPRDGRQFRYLSYAIAGSLSQSSVFEWDAILRDYSEQFGLELSLLEASGKVQAGPQRDFPAAILPAGQNHKDPKPGESLSPQELARKSYKTGTSNNPYRFWESVQIRIEADNARTPITATLISSSTVDPTRGASGSPLAWVSTCTILLALSIVFWIPLIRHITRPIRQMTEAAEEIAHGHFRVDLQSNREDEIGRLGRAIDHLARRIRGFVKGQKRFLGDIAHELCSPIARIQAALGILDQRADDRMRAYVQDLQEEVEQMSELISELLSFSKTGIETQKIVIAEVPIDQIVADVLAREAQGVSNISADVPNGLKVIVEPSLLNRAVANLVRNAIRYAGDAGPIEITARAKFDFVELTVADSGQGVPEEAIAQIFDPFYRTEPSRNRSSGGVGLGMAIVKSCVEASGGVITCRNREPSGLEVKVRLRTPLHPDSKLTVHA